MMVKKQRNSSSVDRRFKGIPFISYNLSFESSC